MLSQHDWSDRGQCMKKDTHISSLVPSPPCRKQQQIACVLVCMWVCMCVCVCIFAYVELIIYKYTYLFAYTIQYYVQPLSIRACVRTYRQSSVPIAGGIEALQASCKESPYITEIAKHIQCIGTYNQELPIIHYTICCNDHTQGRFNQS